MLKNLASTSFCWGRRASWSLQQGPLGPGERPAGLGEWRFSPETLSTSRFGCTQSRFPRDRQGRQMRTAQRRQEPRRVSGQISFSWFAGKPNQSSLPANAAIGPELFFVTVEISCVEGWNKKTMRGGCACIAIYSVPTDAKPSSFPGRPLLQFRYPFQELSHDRAIQQASRLQHGFRFLRG